MRHALPGLLCLFAAVAAHQAQAPAPVLLEMRPMPDTSDDTAAVTAARQQLLTWLDRDGHRELVQRTPVAVHLHRDELAGKGDGVQRLRWYPHVLRPRNGDHWSYSFLKNTLAPITVPLFEPKRLESAPLRADETLVELVLIDVAGEHFTGADLGKVSSAMAAAGPCILFELTPARKGAYSVWSQSLIKRHSAIILDGQLTSAPVFESRIPGEGAIHGNFKPADADRLCAGLQAALDHPWTAAPRDGAPPIDDRDALVAIAHMVQLGDAPDAKQRRASALALRDFVDHPAWTAPRLAQCLSQEKDAGVLMDLVVTVGLLEAEGKPMLSRLAQLEAHDDKQLAQLAHKTRQRIEQALAKR